MLNLHDINARIQRATNFAQAYPGKFCLPTVQTQEVSQLLSEIAQLREENARLRGIIMAKNAQERQ